MLGRLLERAALQPGAQAHTALRMHLDAEKLRVYKLGAANQLNNELINGLVLTVSDVR